MLIEILDPTQDGTLNIINNKGKSCGVKSFNITYECSGYDDLVSINIEFSAYTDILGEEIR